MLFLLWTAAPALAGSLTLGSGSVVVVTDVAASDGLAKERESLLGEVCAVGNTPLTSAGDGWWRGSLVCANGSTYTATAVAVSVPGTAAQPRSVSAASIAQQLGTTIKLDGSGSALSAAPTDALRRSVLAGEAVRIVGLAPEDAYYEDRGGIVGKACYPTDDMSQNADGWHGGPMKCRDGDDYYFYKVALASDPTHASQELTRPPSASLPEVRGTLEDGTRVVVRGVSDEDAFYPDRADFLGKECKVTGDLHPQDTEGWYGGGLTCKKKYYYFYKVQVEVK